VVVLTGTVPATAAGGATFTLVSTVAGTVHDPALGNNVATTVGAIPRPAQLAASGSTPDGGVWLAALLLLAGFGALGGAKARRAATLE